MFDRILRDTNIWLGETMQPIGSNQHKCKRGIRPASAEEGARSAFAALSRPAADGEIARVKAMPGMTIDEARDRSRLGEWWVADEEPEIFPAKRARPNRIMVRSALRRAAVVLGVAVAAGLGGALFF